MCVGVCPDLEMVHLSMHCGCLVLYYSHARFTVYAWVRSHKASIQAQMEMLWYQ